MGKMVLIIAFIAIGIGLIQRGREKSVEYNLLLCVLSGNISSYIPNMTWQIVGWLVIFVVLSAATRQFCKRKASQ